MHMINISQTFFRYFINICMVRYAQQNIQLLSEFTGTSFKSKIERRPRIMTALLVALAGIGIGGAMAGYYTHRKHQKRYVQISLGTIKSRMAA